MAEKRETMNVVTVPIDDVKVSGRFRQDLGDLKGLMISIERSGLFHPILVTPSLQLIAGQRRLEAVRRLGSDSIEARVAEGLGDAVDLLVAERDENTCRLDMKPSEVYALGKRIEELERPKAADRQRAAGKRGGTRSGSFLSDDKKLHTYEVVATTVGMSPAQWMRLKQVGDRATEGDAVAIKTMEDIDKGKQTVYGGYNDLRSGGPDRDLGNVGDKRSIPRKKQGGNQLRQLASKIKDLGNLVKMIDLDGLTKEEADSIAADLSQGLAALNSLRNQLRKVNP